MHIIYGGTFDPIHNGHLRVAIELKEMLGVDQVNLVPSHIPPHREIPGGTGQDRLELLRLAVAGEPGLGVDAREVNRSGASYTADTLGQLRDEIGPLEPLAMVVGTDAFAAFHRWREWEKIPELAHIILVTRPQSAITPGSEPEKLLSRRRVTSAAELNSRPAGGILEVEPPLLDISASGIRKRLSEGRSVQFLVPDAVLEEIRRRGLYGYRQCR